jgi:glutamate N-acetyltransferase/amino-acid N-acetyltransferase
VGVKLPGPLAGDGEGATRLVTVSLEGARDEESAAVLAKAVASSNLVKTACFGADANWGRILCALGYAGVDFDPEQTEVSFFGAGEELPVYRGVPVEFSEEKARSILSGEEIEIRIRAGSGPGSALVWGCDLGYEYVRINGDYRS